MARRSGKPAHVDPETHKIGSAAAATATGVMVGKAISIIFLGLSFIVVARLLGPSLYGIYTLALAVAGFGAAIGNFGVGIAMNRFIPEYLYKGDKRSIEDILANSFFVTIVMSLAIAVATIALSGMISTNIFHNASYTLVIDIAAVSIISSMLFSASYSALLGFNKGLHLALANTVQAVLQSALSVLFVFMGFGAAAPIIGMIIGYSAGFLYSLYLIYSKNGLRMLVMPSIDSIKKIFRFSVPISVSLTSMSLVYNLAFIVVGAYATTVVIGNLGVASKVNSFIDIVAGSISVSLLSMYSTTLASKRVRAKISQFYNHTVYYSFILLAPILLFIVVLAQPFSYVAFSSVYRIAPLFIAIMGIGALIALAGQYANTLLMSANKVKKVFKYNMIISAAQLVLIFILIPLFKGIGLVLILFIIVPILTNILYIRSSDKLFRLGFDIMKLLRIMAANGISMLLIVPLIIIWQSNYIPLLITAAIELVIIYPIILGLVRGVDRNDTRILGSMTNKIPVLGAAFGAVLRYTAIFVR